MVFAIGDPSLIYKTLNIKCDPWLVVNRHWNESERYRVCRLLAMLFWKLSKLELIDEFEVQKGVEVETCDTCDEEINMVFSHVVDFVSS